MPHLAPSHRDEGTHRVIKLYSHPGLIGLEIWDGLAQHAPLHLLRTDRPAYFRGLDTFLHDLHSGRARTASGEPLTAAQRFSRLLLAGGDAEEASRYLTLPHEVAAPGPFAARAGAEAIWRELRLPSPVAFDLGQTRWKRILPDAETAWERDESHLPFGRDALPRALGRRRLRALLRQRLPRGAGGVVLGLPCRVTPAGVAQGCTYPGMDGPLTRLLGGLVPSGLPVIALNDAVLIARGFPPSREERTLVLTLGFGAGAAVWNPAGLA